MQDPKISENTSLKAILDAKKSDFESRAPQEKQRIYQEGILDVVNKGIIEQATW